MQRRTRRPTPTAARQLLGLLGLLGVTLGLGAGASAAADPAPAAAVVDLHGLYQRLRPGMTVGEVATAAGRARLASSAEPVTSWLVWSRSPDGTETAVLRAAFRDDRLLRVEYESFGEEYRRRVKGGDLAVEVAAPELRRLLRRTWEAQEAAVECDQALEAFHRLVLGAQARLTPEEQRAWVRALEQRRSAQRELGRVAR